MSKYHNILGVSADASASDIKKAYRKLASQHHPDKGGDNEKFQEVQEAYERVTNPEKFKPEQFQHYRSKVYSRPGNGWQHVNSSSLRDHFEELLRQQQQTLRLHFEIDLESTLNNQTRTIHFPEHNIPPMEITIPAGISQGESIQYNNIPSTDDGVQNRTLIIHFIIAPHKDFHVVDQVHLLRSETVNALDAMVGTTLEVKTIEGTTLKVALPAGTQNGQKLKIAGKGLKYKENTNYRGDMYVDIAIKIPTLTESEKTIITELRNNKTNE